MKSWDKLQADETRILKKHFTPGRSGRKIDRIVIHHNAGNLSISQIYNTWQTRRASAHYQVDENGRIGQLVWDGNTAWHAANADINGRSIGIEHANNAFSPRWTVSSATLEEGAHLVAALCVYYKLGRPVWGGNVFPHSRYSSTACPGALQGAQRTQYMSRAQAWYDSMTGKAKPKPKPTPKPTAKLAEDGRLGTQTVKALQRFLNKKVSGKAIAVDGRAGAATWRHLQTYLKAPYVDGVISRQSYTAKALGNGIVAGKAWGYTGRGSKGSQTVKLLQKLIGTTADGIWGPNTTKALQRYLNREG